MSIHELYGRLAEDNAKLMEARCQENAAHMATLRVLADLKSGKLTLEQVEVKAEGDRIGWKKLLSEAPCTSSDTPSQ